MPRYYFDVDDGETLTCDDEGLDLDDMEEARREAVRTLPEVAKDALPDGNERTFAVTVRDEARCPILRAQLKLTVDRLPSN
jgi:hypothetical protein